MIGKPEKQPAKGNPPTAFLRRAREEHLRILARAKEAMKRSLPKPLSLRKLGIDNFSDDKMGALMSDAAEEANENKGAVRHTASDALMIDAGRGNDEEESFDEERLYHVPIIRIIDPADEDRTVTCRNNVATGDEQDNAGTTQAPNPIVVATRSNQVPVPTRSAKALSIPISPTPAGKAKLYQSPRQTSWLIFSAFKTTVPSNVADWDDDCPAPSNALGDEEDCPINWAHIEARTRGLTDTYKTAYELHAP